MSRGSQVAGFSASYVLDLTERFINWQMIGAVFVLLVAPAVPVTVDPRHGVCRRDYDLA